MKVILVKEPSFYGEILNLYFPSEIGASSFFMFYKGSTGWVRTKYCHTLEYKFCCIDQGKYPGYKEVFVKEIETEDIEKESKKILLRLNL